METKKKHISNRHPADALNKGIRFDEQLKAKKEEKEREKERNQKTKKAQSDI